MQKLPKFMKRILFLCFMALVTTSCHVVYNAKILESNYHIRMNTQTELDIKSKVRIFLSENEINDEYEVISFNKYKPYSIPIILSHRKQLYKKFYENAVKKAYDLGGNGIIITSGGTYKVIYINNWDSDNAQPAKYVNAILDTTLMDIFKSNKISTLSPREVKRCVTDFSTEIEFNLKLATTYEEILIVEEKLNTFYEWAYSPYSQRIVDSWLIDKFEAFKKILKIRKRRIMAQNNIIEEPSTSITIKDEGTNNFINSKNINKENTICVGAIVEYNKTPAVIAKITNNGITIVGKTIKTGTWESAMKYCMSLGYKWHLPSGEELAHIRKELAFEKYWTCNEINENKAEYYETEYNQTYKTDKVKDLLILPIAIVDINEIELITNNN